MDQNIETINTTTRIEKIKIFILENKKKLLLFILIVIISIFGYFFYQDLEKKNKIKLSDKYNSAVGNFTSGDNSFAKKYLIEIINEKDKTYSPLSLFFLIDNDLISSDKEINKFFDMLIDNTNLDKEIKNLIILKKAVFNSEKISENNLINILNPLINSESVWKTHALYLLAEFFYFNEQNKKALEFFQKIIELENVNPQIKLEAQKRIQRDLSE